MTPDEAIDPFETEEFRAGEAALRDAELRLERTGEALDRLTARIARLKKRAP